MHNPQLCVSCKRPIFAIRGNRALLFSMLYQNISRLWNVASHTKLVTKCIHIDTKYYTAKLKHCTSFVHAIEFSLLIQIPPRITFNKQKQWEENHIYIYTILWIHNTIWSNQFKRQLSKWSEFHFNLYSPVRPVYSHTWIIFYFASRLACPRPISCHVNYSVWYLWCGNVPGPGRRYYHVWRLHFRRNGLAICCQ